jgi:precorrin-2/cobalt-factor-2 C20-methyltransferase
MTLKALRILRSCPVVAYFSARSRPSNARQVVEEHLRAGQTELHLVYPVTTETVPPGTSYETLLTGFYDASATELATFLDSGRDVVVLCEGDPFLHGSFMYLYNRLGGRYQTEVVPGVASMLAGSAVIGAPLVCRDEVLTVLPGTLEPSELEVRLRQADAAVVMKVGRHLGAIRHAVTAAGLLSRAWYVERATMSNQLVLPLAEVDIADAPYFSMVVIPSRAAGAR